MGVCVHQGSVLSSLLFIQVQEEVLFEFRTGALWGLLYLDDLVLRMDIQRECISKLKGWKAGMGCKGLCVNMKKTNFLVSGHGHDVFEESDKCPCAVCCRGVGYNYIQCSQCILWVHKKYNGITKRLVADSNYVCLRCKGGSQPIDGRTMTEVDVDGCMLDVEATFCYISGMLCAGGAVTVPLLPHVWPGEVQGTSASPNHQTPLT